MLRFLPCAHSGPATRDSIPPVKSLQVRGRLPSVWSPAVTNTSVDHSFAVGTRSIDNGDMCSTTHAYWPAWRHCMRATPGSFQGYLKRVCHLETCRTSIVAALDGLHRGLCTLTTPTTCAHTPTMGRFTDLCLPCRKAFASRKAWAGHAARAHGYRSRAFLLGSTPVCLSCGRSYGSIGRLRRHLAVVPRCAAQWGSFKTDQEAPPSSHLMAPPEPVAGLRCEVPSPWDPSLSHALLAELDQLNECSEDLVWTTIEDQIEPLSILRATVEAWRDFHSDSSWHAETAENMLRLLDPQVIAEHFPEEGPYVEPPVSTLLQPLRYDAFLATGAAPSMCLCCRHSACRPDMPWTLGSATSPPALVSGARL